MNDEIKTLLAFLHRSSFIVHRWLRRLARWLRAPQPRTLLVPAPSSYRWLMTASRN